MAGLFKRWRWGLFGAGVALGLVIWLTGAKVDPGHAFLFGLGAMSYAFLLISTDVAAWLATPVLKFIDSIYLPGAHSKKAPLAYELPIYYERHFRSEEALAAYLAIIRNYPRQINAYAGAIRVCRNQLHDSSKASHWLREAERLFGQDEIHRAVARTAEEWHAERMKSALAPAPSH